MVKLTDFPAAEVMIENPPRLPELSDKLCDMILGFATHVHDPECLHIDDEIFLRSGGWPHINSVRKKVLLLGKRFHVSNPLTTVHQRLTSRHLNSASGSVTCTVSLTSSLRRR